MRKGYLLTPFRGIWKHTTCATRVFFFFHYSFATSMNNLVKKIHRLVILCKQLCWDIYTKCEYCWCLTITKGVKRAFKDKKHPQRFHKVSLPQHCGNDTLQPKFATTLQSKQPSFNNFHYKQKSVKAINTNTPSTKFCLFISACQHNDGWA